MRGWPRTLLALGLLDTATIVIIAREWHTLEPATDRPSRF
jgi:hypothetical protein